VVFRPIADHGAHGDQPSCNGLLQIRAVWAHPTETIEGEKHWAILDIDFSGPMHVKFPGQKMPRSTCRWGAVRVISTLPLVTMTHYINPDSPLYKSYFEDRAMKGRIFMEVIGYDMVLHEEVGAHYAPRHCTSSTHTHTLSRARAHSLSLSHSLTHISRWFPGLRRLTEAGLPFVGARSLGV
jgi:hypothetical protein